MKLLFPLSTLNQTHLLTKHVVPEGEALVAIAPRQLLLSGEACQGPLLNVGANGKSEEDSGTGPHFSVRTWQEGLAPTKRGPSSSKLVGSRGRSRSRRFRMLGV